jgi:hypothetical protein
VTPRTAYVVLHSVGFLARFLPDSDAGFAVIASAMFAHRLVEAPTIALGE